MSATEPSEPSQPPAEAVEPLLETPPSYGHPFPIVGIGASAGGLEAFTELLTSLPASPGLAVLFVQHLEPHHKSQLADILGRVSPLPIREAAEGMQVEADHVYLIPPNTNMALVDGKLGLSPRSHVRGATHMPVDYLFRSLAEIQKERAIGVILSGGGTDGTLGFQAIKAEGGITFAQDEKTARHESMPRSAVMDGNVDYVLPPGEIARQLARLATHPYTRAQGPAGAPVAPADADITNQVIGLLRTGTRSISATTNGRRCAAASSGVWPCSTSKTRALICSTSATTPPSRPTCSRTS
jgi:two-component system CheB/CheR fusion protein